MTTLEQMLGIDPDARRMQEIERMLTEVNIHLIEISKNLQSAQKETDLWSKAQDYLTEKISKSGSSLGNLVKWYEYIKMAVDGIQFLYGKWEERQERLNHLSNEMLKINQDAATRSGAYKTQIDTLVSTAENDKLSYENRAHAIKQLNTMMPNLIAFMDEEGKLIMRNRGAIDSYLIAMKNYELARRSSEEKEKIIGQISEIKAGNYDDYVKVGWMEKANAIMSSFDIAGKGTFFKAYHDSLELSKKHLAENYIKELEKKLALIEVDLKRYTSSDLVVEKLIGKPQPLGNLVLAKQPGSEDEIKPTRTEKTEEEKAAEARAKDEQRQRAATIKQLTQQLSQVQLDSENRKDALLLAASKAAAKSKMAQLKIDQEEELKAIKKKYEDIDRLESELKKNGGLNKETKKQIEGSREAVKTEENTLTKKQKSDTNELNKSSKETIDALWKEVSDRSASELDKSKAAVEKYYDDVIKKMKEAGATEEELNKAKSDLAPIKEKETTQVIVTYDLKQLDFTNEIETKQLELSNKSVYIEADKQRRIYELQSKYYEEQKKLLRQKTDDESKHKLDLLSINEEILNYDKAMFDKRQDIMDKYYLFSSSKELALLEISKKSIQGKSEKLKAKQDKGETSPEENEEIKYLEKSLQKIDKLKAESYGKIGAEAVKTMTDIAAVIGQFDGDLGQGLSMVANLAGSAASLTTGIMSGNPQAIIQGGLQLAGSIANIINMNKKANEEIRKFNDGLAQQAIDYSLALINAVKNVPGVNDSIFNADIGNKLTQGMEGYNQAIAKQKELMDGLGDTTVKVGVKKKKFLGITTGTKIIYDSLLKNYPDLITKEGDLNRELADTLLKSGNLSKEAEKSINNIIKAEDAAKAAMDQVNSNLSSIAGSLGSDLQNALVEAFKSGGDAAVEFGKSVGKIMENMITQMLFSAIFGEQLKELEDMMKDSYSEYGDHDLTDDITWFYNVIGGGIDAFNQGLKDAQTTGSSRGFNLFAPTEEAQRQGISGQQGLAQASQESISELNGRMLASMMLVTEIRDQGRERQIYDRAVKSQLEVIANNTTYCQYLLDIRNTLDSIDLKGVKVKM